MAKTLILTNSELAKLTKKLKANFLEKRIISLSGDLGSGKTTLTQALAKELGVSEEVTSPTFNLLNIYDSPHGQIYHFDLYRLENPEEIYNIGLEEALENHLTIIEWPEIAKDLLPEKTITIKISGNAKETRTYEF